MFDNRDFTVCENCGGNCYIGNKYCEDCANELWEVECQINSDTLFENKILEQALELACKDVKYCKEMWFYEKWGEGITYDVNQIIEEYEQRAKEKMKSE